MGRPANSKRKGFSENNRRVFDVSLLSTTAPSTNPVRPLAARGRTGEHPEDIRADRVRSHFVVKVDCIIAFVNGGKSVIAIHVISGHQIMVNNEVFTVLRGKGLEILFGRMKSPKQDDILPPLQKPFPDLTGLYLVEFVISGLRFQYDAESVCQRPLIIFPPLIFAINGAATAF